MESVYCAVRTGSWNVTQVNARFKRVTLVGTGSESKYVTPGMLSPERTLRLVFELLFTTQRGRPYTWKSSELKPEQACSPVLVWEGTEEHYTVFVVAVGTVAACCTTRIYAATLCSFFSPYSYVWQESRNIQLVLYRRQYGPPKRRWTSTRLRDDLTHEGKVFPVRAVKTRLHTFLMSGVVNVTLRPLCPRERAWWAPEPVRTIWTRAHNINAWFQASDAM